MYQRQNCEFINRLRGDFATGVLQNVTPLRMMLSTGQVGYTRIIAARRYGGLLPKPHLGYLAVTTVAYTGTVYYPWA